MLVFFIIDADYPSPVIPFDINHQVVFGLYDLFYVVIG